jgi:hypothetical protein
MASQGTKILSFSGGGLRAITCHAAAMQYLGLAYTQFDVVSGNSGGAWFMTLMSEPAFGKNSPFPPTSSNNDNDAEQFNQYIDACGVGMKVFYDELKNNTGYISEMVKILSTVTTKDTTNDLLIPFFYYLSKPWQEVTESIIFQTTPDVVKAEKALTTSASESSSKKPLRVWASTVLLDAIVTNDVKVNDGKKNHTVNVTYKLTMDNNKGNNGIDSYTMCYPVTFTDDASNSNIPFIQNTWNLTYYAGATPIKTSYPGILSATSPLPTSPDTNNVHEYFACASGAAVGGIATASILQQSIEQFVMEFGNTSTDPSKLEINDTLRDEKISARILKYTKEFFETAGKLSLFTTITFIALANIQPELADSMKDNVIMIAIILVIFAGAWTTFYAMEDRIVVEIVRIVSNTIVKSAIPVKLNTQQGKSPATMTFTKSGRVEDVDDIKELPPYIRLADGGYFDNSSVAYAIAAHQVKQANQELNILLINSMSEYDATGTSTTVTNLFGNPIKPLPRFGDLKMNTPSPAIFSSSERATGTTQWSCTLGLGESNNVQCNLTTYNGLTTITNQHVGVRSDTKVNLYVLNIATPSANIFLTPGNADANALGTYKQAFLNIQTCLGKKDKDKDKDLKSLLNSFFT